MTHDLHRSPDAWHRAGRSSLLSATLFAALVAACNSDDPVAPIVVTEPADQTVAEGSNASFTVGVVGSDPLAYEWRAGSSTIGGANGATLSVGPVALSQSGTRYSATVSNSAGAASTRQATLTVTPRAWSATPIQPETGTEPAAGRAAAVADAQGNFTFAAQGPGFAPGRPAIWVARSAPGTTTPTVVDISSVGVPAGRTSNSQRVAVDASGRTLIVWAATDPGNGQTTVYAALKAWGAGADAEAVAISGPSVFARNPDVAAVSDGVFEVVWRETTGGASAHDIVARRFTASGGTWSAQEVLEERAADVDAPRIASDGAGHLWAVWAQMTPGTAQVVGVERTASQSAWNPAAVTVLDGTSSPGLLYAPQVQLDGSGHGVLAYHDVTGIVYVRRLVDGVWSTPQYVANWASNTEPAIALHAGSGRISIASLAAGTGQSRLYHWGFDPVDGWSQAFTVRSVTTGYTIEQPSVGFDSAGNAVVGWVESTGESGNGSVVRARRFMAGSLGWMADAPIISEDFTAGEANLNLALVVAPSGAAAAWWNRYVFGNTTTTSTPRLSLLR